MTDPDALLENLYLDESDGLVMLMHIQSLYMPTANVHKRSKIGDIRELRKPGYLAVTL